MIILSSFRLEADADPIAARHEVISMPIFPKLVKDIKKYVSRVKYFDRNFITIGFLFQIEVLGAIDSDLVVALIKRTI